MEQLVEKISRRILALAVIPGGYYFVTQSLFINKYLKYVLKPDVNEDIENRMKKVIGQVYFLNGIHPEANIKFYETNKNRIMLNGSSEMLSGAYLGVPTSFLEECTYFVHQIPPYSMNNSLNDIDIASNNTTNFALAQSALAVYNKKPLMYLLATVLYPVITLSLSNTFTCQLYNSMVKRIKTNFALQPQNLYPNAPSSIQILICQRRTLRYMYPLLMVVTAAIIYMPLSIILSSYNSYIQESADKDVATAKPLWVKGGINYLKMLITEEENLQTHKLADDVSLEKNVMNKVKTFWRNFKELVEMDIEGTHPQYRLTQLKKRLIKLEEIQKNHDSIESQDAVLDIVSINEVEKDDNTMRNISISDYLVNSTYLYDLIPTMNKK